MTDETPVTAATLTLRQASQADVPFMLALREQTMDQHFRASGVNVTREQHLERVRVRFDCAQIIEHEGRPAGVFKAVREGLAWQLIQIQLAPELQGRGIGEQLIRRLSDEARQAGATLSLEVLHANPARRLYERLGFQIVAETDHAYVMQLSG